MASTIFVTGGTGLTGANVCEQLVERGDDVRALVRNPDEAGRCRHRRRARQGRHQRRRRRDAGAKVVTPRSTARRCSGVRVRTSTTSAPSTWSARRTCSDAGKAHGMRRVVALSTATFFDLNTDLPFEEAPVLENPPDDPYTVTKLAAFRGGARACRRGRRRADMPPWRDLRPGASRGTGAAPHQLQSGAAGRNAWAHQAISRRFPSRGWPAPMSRRFHRRTGPWGGRRALPV